MNLEYVPVLQIQRELQGLPRDRARFERYLRTIYPDGVTLDLPLLLMMNPMGKDHVTQLLDALLALDADKIAAESLAQASAKLQGTPGDFKLGLVVSDDLMGGWTNRYDYEFNLCFQSGTPVPDRPRPRWLKDHWLAGILWSSEPASEKAVREAVLTAVYRAAYIHEQGLAKTLRDLLAQEGHVRCAAGCTTPTLAEDDIAYTREVLTPFLDATEKRTCMECLFGDEAGRTLGFTPRGLSHWAGLALALHDAMRSSPSSIESTCEAGR